MGNRKSKKKEFATAKLKKKGWVNWRLFSSEITKTVKWA